MRRLLWLLALSCLLAFPAVARSAPRSETGSPGLVDARDAHVLWVALPGRSNPTGAWDREALMEHARRAVAERTAPAARIGDEVRDLVVMFTENGRPVRPDLDDPVTTLGAATNGLRFTFHSPQHPWTAEDLATLERMVGDFYPLALTIFGPPAFDITVNVRQDPNSSYDAYYVPAANEIVLWRLGGSLCHEMLHAFHDDAIFEISVYEEGMARAGEIAVYNALESWEHWDERHRSDFYDVYYDLLNTPDVGTLDGNAYGMRSMLRYQMAGYAWAKPYLENPEFFARFHQGYYAARASDPFLSRTASRLLAIAAAAQPVVEGEPFEAWARSQYVLRLDAPPGRRLHQRMIDDASHFCRTQTDYFYRESSYGEQPRGGEPVDWKILDHSGRELSRGTDVTTSWGTAENVGGEVPRDYVGRMTVVTSVVTPTGKVLTDTTYRPSNRTAGIFGVVRGALAGEVAAEHLDSGLRETAAVTNGCFELPAMEPLAGAFRVTFRDPDGRRIERRVTKDASHYYVMLDKPPAPVVTDLAPNGSFEASDLAGWDAYHGSTLMRASGLTGTYGIYVYGPPRAEQFGINDHPNFVASVPAAGTTYRYTAWVYTLSTYGTCRIRVREYRDDVRLGGSSYSNPSVRFDQPPLSDEWQELSLDYTARGAGTSLDFQVVLDLRPGYTPSDVDRARFWLDAVSIRALSPDETPAAAASVVPEAEAVEDSDRDALAASASTDRVRFAARAVPSPSAGAVSLWLTLVRPGPIRVEVFDAGGRSVGTPITLPFAPAGSMRVALGGASGQELPAGLYWYRLAAADGVLTGRLVVLD